MAELWQDYRDAFVDADVMVLTDIYPSGTTPIPGVTGKLVVNAVSGRSPSGHRMAGFPTPELVQYLGATLQAGDVAISMGCGDIATLPTEVLEFWMALHADLDGAVAP